MNGVFRAELQAPPPSLCSHKLSVSSPRGTVLTSRMHDVLSLIPAFKFNLPHLTAADTSGHR